MNKVNGSFWMLSFAVCLLVACGSSTGSSSGSDGSVGPQVPECQDGEDNDRDGVIDHPADPGCMSPDDTDETDERAPQCTDGLDNDEDGQIDLDDRGCTNRDDDDESDEAPLSQCRNGLDDDEDGDIDLDDDGCVNAADDDESDEPQPSQCDDGLDNDNDGFIDFPADPGCGSAFDSDETDDNRILPQCADERDNDGDGLFDLADPGCSSVADPREQNTEEQPACSNGLDDDGDGLVDFPLEPGCSAAGDDDEQDGARQPACGNGLDDDNDGEIDYPLDPGCMGVGDMDETDPMTSTACSDNLDNDRDGEIDYPADPGCVSRADRNEQAQCTARINAVEVRTGQVYRGDSGSGQFNFEGSCGGRGAAELVFYYRLTNEVEALEITTELPDNQLETAIYVRRNCADEATELVCQREPLNDGVAANSLRLDEPIVGDYYIFIDGATGQNGAFAVQVNEVPLAQCRNGIDDDDDGRTDYPIDPGCLSLSDRDETDPEQLPACFDGMDNDADGLIDYPLDIGCRAASDSDEIDSCGQGIAFDDFPSDELFVDGNTDGGTNQFQGGCGGDNRVERIYRYVNTFNANLTFSVNNEETIANTLVYARTSCASAQTEIACDTGDRENPKGTIELTNVAPGELFVFVDTGIGIGGAFRLTVNAERLPPGCSDARDNDGDGSIDQDDVGCSGPDDEDEVDDEVAPACADGIDNDGDGLVDFPVELGCNYRGGDSEEDPMQLPACGDGLDNDDDGVIDFPDEPGCISRGDTDEANQGRPECNNRIDDDEDGLTDYPLDPGCGGVGDLSEGDPPTPPQCADEVDNDRNGLVDFPFDPGCRAAGDSTEEPLDMPAACSDDIDNDDDGIVDFPREPGCASAGDTDEADPNFPTQCSDGRDNDNNGRIDWPDDPGCRFAADTREQLQGNPPKRCADGVDNDDDGLVDLADSGCQNARDNDETDVFADNHCSDGIDNDADGLIDWPVDDGCEAQGAQCEQLGHGLCDGECRDLISDANHCGACNRTCEADVECIDGFCGGLYVFEGIQQNISDDILGGWETCHNDLYGDGNTMVQQLQDNCDGAYVMLGCRQVGSPTWQLIAMGERNAVFTNTGDRGNNLNSHNGVDWYFSTSYSIGFVAPNSGVSRNSCDTANNQSEFRLCWHTSGGRLNGGYRCGARTGLNGSRDYERRVWTSAVGQP